ncbi:hypothetical protein Ocin01_03679 [Orchesella cincta]|uniref:Uncharacterized protein n=1 Tax=Orchesella cincta TaxID=48709 RepID=A0A1D2NCN0_ORCCI|nr:hypothetical protein Ocin01_03679 [Orchesella cincta]
MEGYYPNEAVISALSDLQYQMQVVNGFLSWNFPDYARLRSAMDQQHSAVSSPSMFANHHMPHFPNILPPTLGGTMKLPADYHGESQEELVRINGSSLRIGKRQPATKKTNGEPLKRRGRKRKYPLAPVNTNIDISCEKIVLPHNSATYYRHHTTTSLGNEVSVLMPASHGPIQSSSSTIITDSNIQTQVGPKLKDSSAGPQELNRLELLATACFYAKPNELKSDNALPSIATPTDASSFDAQQLHLENVENHEHSVSGSVEVESGHFHTHQQQLQDQGGSYLEAGLNCNNVNGMQMQEHHHHHLQQYRSLDSEEVANSESKSSFTELKTLQPEQDDCDIVSNIAEQEVIVYSS